MSWHSSHISITVYYEMYLFIATWDHFAYDLNEKKMPKCSPWSQSRLTLSVWYHFEIQIYVMYDYSQKIDSSLATSFQRQSVMWDFSGPEQSHVALMGPAFSELVFGCLQRCKGAQLFTSKILSVPWHFSDCLTDGRTWTLFSNLKLPWRWNFGS